eukprot:2022328-Rhodomonas_salina.3
MPRTACNIVLLLQLFFCLQCTPPPGIALIVSQTHFRKAKAGSSTWTCACCGGSTSWRQGGQEKWKELQCRTYPVRHLRPDRWRTRQRHHAG